MPYDYIGNSIAFPDDYRSVGTSRKCCTSDRRPEKGGFLWQQKEKAQKEMTAQRFQPVAVITFVMLDW